MKIIGSENGLMSRAIMLSGFAISAASGFRWTIQYTDLSQAIFGITLGAIIFGLGWSYGQFKAISNRLSKHHRRLEFIGSWITGNKEEAFKESMRFDEDE